jgi:hypothetical protein
MTLAISLCDTVCEDSRDNLSATTHCAMIMVATNNSRSITSYRESPQCSSGRLDSEPLNCLGAIFLLRFRSPNGYVSDITVDDSLRCFFCRDFSAISNATQHTMDYSEKGIRTTLPAPLVCSYGYDSMIE